MISKLLFISFFCLFLITLFVFIYIKYPLNLFNLNDLNDSPIAIAHDHPATPLSQINNHDEEEVFHVAGKSVPYCEAKSVCKQLGAELATYDQILHAYQHGAEWCNYGWTKNQTAYYPTQKHTWEQLQNAENPSDRLICGMPGINGGRFNKNMKFGVNCFGIKPDKPDQDFIHPKLPEPKLKEKKKVKYYHDLVVIPYSRKKWSRDDYEPASIHND